MTFINLTLTSFLTFYRSPVFLLTAFFLLPKVYGIIDLSIIPLLCIFISSIFAPSCQAYSYKLKSYYIVLLSLLGVCLLYSLFGALFVYDSALNFPLKFFRYSLITFISLFSLSRSFLSPLDIFKSAVLASVINTLFSLVQYLVFIFDFKSIMPYIFNPSFDILLSSPFRQPGLMAGYPNSSLLLILGLYSYYFICHYHVHCKPKLWVVLIFSTLASLASRTGLVMSIPLVLYYFYCQLYNIHRVSYRFRISTFVRFIVSLTIIFLLLGLFFNSGTRILSNSTYFLEPFTILFSGDVSSSQSLDALLASYQNYLSTSHFVFGNHLWMLSTDLNNIDNGFFIVLASQGIFILTLCIIFYLFLIAQVPSLYSKIFLFFVFVVFNFKVDVIFVRQASDLFFFLLLASSFFFDAHSSSRLTCRKH